MKKLFVPILIILSFNCFGQPATPTGYNFINSKYDWLEGKFRTLHIPSGGATQTLYGGWAGAGAPYWDSIGKVLSIWDGAAWQTVGGGASTTVGTYAQRIALSPTDGKEFFQTDDGRNAPAGKYYYLNGIWNFTPMADEDFWYYFNDFSGTSATVAFAPFRNLTNQVSGTSASNSLVTANSMFYGRLNSGTATNGYATIATSQASSAFTGLRASTMNMYYQITIQSVSQKSDLTNVFNIDAGFTNGGTTLTAGYYFRYDSTTNANWLYRNGNGALTSTGVAFEAATPYVLEVFVRSDSVFYWINNTQVAAEATGLSTTFFEPYTRIIKSAGSANILMTIDYLKIWARLQTSRTIYGN